MFHEVLRRHDRDPAGGDVGLVHDPEHSAEVVQVRVGVDDGGDRPVGAVLAVQRQAGCGDLLGHQRVDDDDALAPLDEGHVGQVHAADLVNALDDLEQAVDRGQPALPPQVGVDGPGGGFGAVEEEGEVAQVPDGLALFVGDALRAGGDEAPVGVVEVGGVVRGRPSRTRAGVPRPGRPGDAGGPASGLGGTRHEPLLGCVVGPDAGSRGRGLPGARPG
ncbi:hypothetical protein H4W79_004716 [Nocardiopsis terrae]|uniref:Uncharacterized protein n=1 Tax=Nocardiopsis terrae TaxID=372655 RepID=A0ABR9HNB3_9ACTN|nr:hypothetical protein [Nocardiopsis terrae]